MRSPALSVILTPSIIQRKGSYESGFGRYLIGGILVILGALLLLSKAGVLPQLDWGLGGFWSFVGSWWPLILVAVGLIGLVSGGFRFRLWPIILLLLGVGFLLSARGILEWAYIWPALIVLAGLFILLRRRERRRNDEISASIAVEIPPETGAAAAVADHAAGDAGDAGDAGPWRRVYIFSGGEDKVADPNFAGGVAAAIFGGLDLDLRDAALAGGKANLEVTAIFGGVKLQLPPGWRVDLRNITLAGGVEQKRQQPTPEQTVGELTITGTVMMGGLEITD